MNTTNTEHDFPFKYLFENNFSKMLSVSITSFMVLFGGPLYYPIIWYERFGINMTRTLINQVKHFLVFFKSIEASKFDRINMTEKRLENDRKKITPTNMTDGS